MDIIREIECRAREAGHEVVHRWRGGQLTFAGLQEMSSAFASWLGTRGLERGEPVVIYGHKQSAMIECFIGCVRAGHPYIPLDSSLPVSRVASIIASSATRLVVAVSPLDAEGNDFGDDVRVVPYSDVPLLQDNAPGPDAEVGLDEPFYIIYTSGSTGTPKGVQISRRAVNSFAEWALSLVGGHGPHVFLNQAPFSFDLSVFELAMALVSGSTIWSLDRDHVENFRDLFALFSESEATVWVSTPSFADLCLASPEFTASLLPEVHTFLFCGEALDNRTAAQLRERFPGARVVNTYGPTESTVAVTSVEIDDKIIAEFPILPIGRSKPGTTIHIIDDCGQKVADGELGEIVIAGDTVSLGYFRRDDLTSSAFTMIDGEWAYRTGDIGYVSRGLLHFSGRLDFQVKLHGYRIETEDVESNIRKLDGVQNAVVLPVIAANGQVCRLVAVVQLEAGVPDGPLQCTLELKSQLRSLIPDYMIPKVFKYVEAIPLNANGKVDRVLLRATL